MTIIEKVENFLFKNMGVVNVGKISIVRSGQPGFIRRWIIYKLTGFKSIVNIADSSKDSQDSDEAKWAKNRGISYNGFQWGAGGPPEDYSEVDKAVSLLLSKPSPVWVHCEGGKDRTGGLVGILQARFGLNWETITKDWNWYGEPASGWQKAIKKELGLVESLLSKLIQ